MRNILIWSVVAAFLVCGAVGAGTAGAVEPALRPMQERTDTGGRWGRRGHRRGGRGGFWIRGGYGPGYYAPPRRHYRYYAPPPPVVVYRGSPCYYSAGGMLICP